MASIRARSALTPPITYSGIDPGSSFSWDHDVLEGASIPVDNSNASLRSYSPFVIRLIPPAILGARLASGGSLPYAKPPKGSGSSEEGPEEGDLEAGLRPPDDLVPSNDVFGLIATQSLEPDGTIVETQLESMTPLDFIQRVSTGRTGGFLDFRGAGFDQHGARYHAGVDIYVPAGAPVLSPFAGTVLRVNQTFLDPEDDGGLNVVIQSRDNPDLQIKVMHLRDVVVAAGEEIEAGVFLGVNYTSDRPGNRFPGGSLPHVHLEAHLANQDAPGVTRENPRVNPYAYMNVATMFGEGFATGSVRQRREALLSSSAEMQVGFYSEAAGSLQNLDTLGSFTRELAQGSIGSISPARLQKLQAYVRGDGEIVRQDINGDQAAAVEIADQRQAADIILQVNAVLNAPPIVLLINPTDISISYTKVQSYQERTRVGYVYQTWGEEQATLAITIKSGTWVSGAGLRGAENSPTPSPSGAQFASRHDSAAWQQFSNLLTFYRNNGYVNDRISRSRAAHMVGSVAIDYDGVTYVGSFTDMSYGFTEEVQNGGLDISMNFKVARMYDYRSSDSQVTPLVNPYGESNPNAAGSTGASSRLGAGGAVNTYLPGVESSVGFAEGLADLLSPEDSNSVPFGVRR